jgi:type VI secretion system secreted protein VgrG
VTVDGRLLMWVQGEYPLQARRFSIHEALNRCFEVTLIARSGEHDIPTEKVVGLDASFRLDNGLAHGAEPARSWTGVCSHFEQLRPERRLPGQSQKGESTYLLRISPNLWLTHHRRTHRIFLKKSIPEIVQEVLKGWEITPTMKLTRPADYYKKLENVVQYGESDFDFVSRLLESAGINYYFEHQPDDATVLVLADEPERNPARAPFPNEDNPTENAQVEFVTHVRLMHHVKPGKVTLRDFDFRKRADVPLLGKAAIPAPPPKHDAGEDFHEHYKYAPAAFRVKADASEDAPVADEQGAWPFRHQEKDGKNLAERRLAALRTGKRSVRFESNAVGVAPGRVFSIKAHQRKDLAPDKTLLLMEYSMDGETNGKWLFSGEAVFTDAPCQPALKTPKPVIRGVQSAIVTGPAGKEIWCDEFGRVKVQLQWDRKGKYDENSSCWMRVSQHWAGTRFGSIMIPRVGQEVLVAYEDGDPDLPIIVGRAYDVTRPVPYALPEHETKSLWKTKTSPAKDNAYNELRFEDKAKDELVYIQAERDYQELVKQNETERTGESRATVVGKNRDSIVGKVDATLVGEKYSLQIMDKPREEDLKILQQKKPTLSPVATKIEMVDERIMGTTGPAVMVLEGKDAIFTAKGEITFQAGDDIIFEGGPNIKINC